MTRERAPETLVHLLDERRLISLGVDPAAEALTDVTTRLSWVDYVDRVARVGAVLDGLGVRAGHRVGVRMSKCCDSFVSVHAVLRIGAVMVPLDALAPEQHTSSVIRDAGIDVVIADRRSARSLDDSGVSAVVLPGVTDADPDGFDRVVDESGIRAADPIDPVDVAADDAAYIIYTSGSTGTPKGIVHTHRSAIAYAAAAADEYGLRADDRFANIAPLHFDQSTFELYAAPLVGGSVVVLPDPALRFPASVSEIVAAERVTVWYSVPYLLEQLAARGALDERDLSALRWVLFGGESFPTVPLMQLVERLPNAPWSNVYGPAEVNQCTAFHFDRPPSGPVPIGVAWSAAEVALVDPDDPGSLRPVERTGMIAVATPTMMRGYWNRTDLDEATIVTDADGTRWYLTGDLASRDETGQLVFLGRVDHQIKIRGHRIELEGVDAALRDVDGVSEATVVADRDGDDDRLVAFVVAAPGHGDELLDRAAELLRARLPRYAVPSEIRLVEQLPRTGTGKVDRIAAAELLGRS